MQRTVEGVLRQVARWPVAASAVAYAILTLISGRLVVAHPASTVVHDLGDPLLTAAILHWNAWTLPFTDAWWQFPIFAPVPDALAFSEHLLGLSVVATPIAWLVRDPLVTANTVTLLTYPLCGVAMFLVVRRLTGSGAAAFVAGLVYAFSPYRAGQQSHLQMLALFWAPLALLGLHGFIESGRQRWLALYAAAWLLQGLANAYTLYFLSSLVALWTLWFVIVPGRWRDLRAITVATLVAAVPLAPTLATYISVHARHGFVRPPFEAMTFSADLTGVLCAPKETALWNWLRVSCRPEAELFPGLVLLGLVGVAIAGLRRDAAGTPPFPLVPRLLRWLALLVAVTGAFSAASVALFGPWRAALAGVRMSASSVDKPLFTMALAALAAVVVSRTTLAAARRRTTAGFYLAAAFVMWALALGPTILFMGVPRPVPGPFRLLALLPGGGELRAPGRFWVMSTLCLAIVAGFASSRLLARLRPRTAVLLTTLLSIGVLSDGWSTIPASPAPVMFPDEPAMRGHAVMSLPVGVLQDFEPQYRAVIAGARSVNGYSGFEPKHYEAVRQGSRFEVDGVFEPFRARGDLFVVVKKDQPRLIALVERQPGAVCTADRFDVRQYVLPRRPTANASPATAAVPVARATASCPAAAAAVDGDVSTRWSCGPQRGAEWFAADLGVPVDRVSGVRYTMGAAYREFPRVLVVETSLDGGTWEPAWNGDVIAPTIEGSLSNPLLAPATLSFPPRRARYVRLRQTGKDDVYWSLPELTILSGG